MITTKCIKFKGEIENYLRNGQNNFDSKINSAFLSLKFKTLLCRTNFIKKDGYHAAHLLFILIILPVLKIKSVNSFCKKHWRQWSESRKDSYYRFKQNTSYRWRSFMYKANTAILKSVELEKIPQSDATL